MVNRLAGAARQARVMRLCLAVAAVFIATACGQFDDVGTLHITNDTQQTVRIVMCGNTCKQSHDRVTLPPGEAEDFNASVGGPREDFRVETPDSVRCLSGELGASDTEIRVLVTAARPCTHEQMRNPSWWDKEFG